MADAGRAVNRWHSEGDVVVFRLWQIWEDASPLRFIQKKGGLVDIEVKFDTGDHGDGEPFDGPGKVLAHAYFPQFGGDTHFDDAEYWSSRSLHGK